MDLSEGSGTVLFKLSAVCYYVSCSSRREGLRYREQLASGKYLGTSFLEGMGSKTPPQSVIHVSSTICVNIFPDP